MTIMNRFSYRSFFVLMLFLSCGDSNLFAETVPVKSHIPPPTKEEAEKAHLLGLSEDHVEPVEIKGDVAIIAGRQ